MQERVISDFDQIDKRSRVNANCSTCIPIQFGSWTLIRFKASDRQALAVISRKPYASASTKAATQANPWFDATRGGYGQANR